MIRTGTSRPVLVTASVAVLLADVLDAVSWVVLDLAGLDRDQARAECACTHLPLSASAGLAGMTARHRDRPRWST